MKPSNKLSTFLLLTTLNLCNPHLFSIGSADNTNAVDAQKALSETCSPATRPDRITLRHIEPNGVGYHSGYTTLEGFFAPSCTQQSCWVPFLDLRGHIFNNGRPAANAGIGLRYLSHSRIWGINAYYDYRKSPKHHVNYSQVAAGLESLGKVWDFRINGYLPFGTKKTHLFQTDFNSFKGHRMILSSKYEFAMKGANAEVGAHITDVKYAKLYAAAGPHVFFNRGRHAWGGEGRVSLDIGDYVRVEGNTSYDSVFKWIGQGQVSLILPFGGKREIKAKNGRSCEGDLVLRERAFQKVDRFEIIVLDRKHKKTVAIDPATGQPYNFVFVNNTSSSNGTFKSPYPTLLLAQNNSAPGDIIYVYQGDGTTNGMNSGIVMQQNQMLFGSGISHPLLTTKGEITIPQMTPGLPMISNSTGDTIILADNNVIAGINIFSSLNRGIFGNGINQATILNNVILTGGSAAAPCIHFDGSGSNFGTIVIQNNTITALADRGMDIFSIGNDNYTLDISGNNLNTNKNAITFDAHANSIITSSIVNNQVFSNVANAGQRSIYIRTHDEALQDITVEGNTITGSTGMLITSSENVLINATIQNNRFVNNINGTALKITAAGAATGTSYFVDITDNFFSNNSPSNLDVNVSSTKGPVCMFLNDNVSTRPLSQTAYSLIGTTAVPINLLPPTNNIGTIVETNVTHFPQCP